MKEPLLEIKDLHVSYHMEEETVKAVNGCTFEVNEKEIVGIIGESGAGKSVLSKAILRLVDSPGKIDSGEIRYHGQLINDMSEKKMREIRGRQISYLLQNPMSAFNPMFSIGHQLKATLKMYHEDRKAIDRRVIELLESVKIESPEVLAKCYPHQFSGGMLQRAAIALSIAGNPDILIADEPTTALDANIRSEILKLIKDLKNDMSIILITHDFQVVEEICDRIIVMYAGEIVESGSKEEISGQAAHPYTQLLLQSAGIISGKYLQGKSKNPVFDMEISKEGCAFCGRCPMAQEICHNRKPKNRKIGNTHWVSCHKYGEENE